MSEVQTIVPVGAPPAVPVRVTRRQARRALAIAGMLDSVELAIAKIPDAQESALAKVDWEDAQNFERDNPTVLALGAAIGLSDADLDALFVLASSQPA